MAISIPYAVASADGLRPEHRETVLGLLVSATVKTTNFAIAH